jgi:hypothetical protein
MAIALQIKLVRYTSTHILRKNIPIEVRGRDFREKREETDYRGKGLVEEGNDVERDPEFAKRPASRR